MDDQPDEILYEIASRLPTADVGSWSLVSRRFSNIADERYWDERLEREFGVRRSDKLAEHLGVSSRRLYREFYLGNAREVDVLVTEDGSTETAGRIWIGDNLPFKKALVEVLGTDRGVVTAYSPFESFGLIFQRHRRDMELSELDPATTIDDVAGGWRDVAYFEYVVDRDD